MANSDCVDRWITGADLEGCHVLRDHQGERQRDTGPAAAGPQLCHQQFDLHHPRNYPKLLSKQEVMADIVAQKLIL